MGGPGLTILRIRRKHEKEINKIPQFTAPVKNSDGNEFNIHFIGIFSENPNAVPLLLMHGWPGAPALPRVRPDLLTLHRLIR